MVEHQLPKLNTRVRFSSLALRSFPASFPQCAWRRHAARPTRRNSLVLSVPPDRPSALRDARPGQTCPNRPTVGTSGRRPRRIFPGRRPSSTERTAVDRGDTRFGPFRARIACPVGNRVSCRSLRCCSALEQLGHAPRHSTTLLPLALEQLGSTRRLLLALAPHFGAIPPIWRRWNYTRATTSCWGLEKHPPLDNVYLAAGSSTPNSPLTRRSRVPEERGKPVKIRHCPRSGE